MSNRDGQAIENQKEKEKILTKKDITKSWFLWWFGAEVSLSFERLQGLAFCCAMIPILKKLYKTKEDLSKALKRHLQFFNTQAIWGGITHGITIALEEQKAMDDEAIPESAIIGVKTGLMGPFAGIGDTIDWATLRPIIFALFIPLAQAGNWIAGVAPIIIFAAITMVEGYLLYHAGYKSGTKSATQILQSGWINQLILGASILGLFMMGGLASSLVSVSTPIAFTIQGMEFKLQEIFDGILPGLLPFLAVTGIYFYLQKESKSYTKVTGVVAILALILGILGIL